ncbi:MAG: sodium-dependent bicarbonate transport family permease [Chthoniobacterales bacterium]
MNLLIDNLLSPILLAFLLGMVAAILKSDLRLPEPVYVGLSIYLLLAIGLKGGIALSETPITTLVAPAGATVILGVITPLIAYWAFRAITKLPIHESSALAAHYGSVSAVTFIAATGFATAAGASPEGYLPALVAILEVPGIVVALLIVQLRGSDGGSWKKALREVLTGKSIVLLVGGLVIGWVAGAERMEKVTPFFVTLFQGALVLFLLELGTIAARRLSEIRAAGPLFVVLTIALPIVNGSLGVWFGTASGLSVGGSAVLGAMAGSASYIAAPAAVRIALPQANPALYLTASLGLTFPFNLSLGIPLYLELARRLA